jgi:hypothetical protein
VGLAYYNLTTTGRSIPRSLAKQLIHPIGGLSTELGQYVGIRVHRKTDLGVTQDLHHNARRYSLNEKQRRAGMT